VSANFTQIWDHWTTNDKVRVNATGDIATAPTSTEVQDFVATSLCILVTQ